MTRLLGEVGHLLRWYGQNDQGDEASDEYDARVLDVCFADTEATSFGSCSMTWHGVVFFGKNVWYQVLYSRFTKISSKKKQKKEKVI